MDRKTLLNNREILAEIISSNNDLIGEEDKLLRQEYSIDSAPQMSKALDNIENSERLLQIGIVGRVKAGKSSLLNALLFEGKEILPKAATPMTAALTVLSYGEILSAEVEFFSQQDIQNIKSQYDEYEHKYKTLKEKKYYVLEEQKKEKLKRAKIDIVVLSQEQKSELSEKAERQTKRELKENQQLSASFDQYVRMKKSGINSESLKESKIINFTSLEEIGEELKEYVGASGRYMPFTKSVNIQLPLDFLKDIQIVDTPGLNDPVQSREERTRELLQFCDVTFIVSPSGQFMNNADLELMDRISTKEGVREIYVLASQIDAQLFASVKRDYDGVLTDVLKGVTSTLGKHLEDTLIQLKKNNPEVGDTFDELINNAKSNLLYTSAIAQNIQLSLDDPSRLDGGAVTVWNNLKQHYPENFLDDDKVLSKANLKILGNIARLKHVISEVRDKKDIILNKRKEEFFDIKMRGLEKYHSALLEYIRLQKEKVKTSDIKDLENEKKSLKKVSDKVSSSLNEEYFQLVDEFETSMKKSLLTILAKGLKETDASIVSAEDEELEEYLINNPNKTWYKPWQDKKITKTKSVNTIRTGVASKALRRFITELQDDISLYSKEQEIEWKKRLFRELVQTIRNDIDDDELDKNIIKSTIRKILSSTIYPEQEYDDKIPASLGSRGVLKGNRADDFLSELDEHLSASERSIRSAIKEYCKNLNEVLYSINPASEIFGNYKKRIENLEQQIEFREVTLLKIERLISRLEAVG